MGNCKDETIPMNITIPKIPPPCQRPRICKSGFIYSPSSKEQQEWANEYFSYYENLFNKDCQLRLKISIVCKKRPRGDVDNIAKFVMDALQKAKVCNDDKQFLSLEITITPDNECKNPYTKINIEEI